MSRSHSADLGTLPKSTCCPKVAESYMETTVEKAKHLDHKVLDHAATMKVSRVERQEVGLVTTKRTHI